MRAAIADALAAVPRANPRAAAPFRTPRDLKALSAFTVVAAAVATLSFHPPRKLLPGATMAAARPPASPEDKQTLDPDDLSYQRQTVEEMHQLAAVTQDENLSAMVKELQELLEQAAKGSITKQALLERMEALEKKYAEGGSESLDKMMRELKQHGQELKKNKQTQRLGEAIEKGDMEAAQKELERLADQVEKGEIKKDDLEKLADALEKTAEKADLEEQKERQRAEKQSQDKIDKKQMEVRRLEKKIEKNPQDEEAKRTLEKERRELERLERDKKEASDKPRRQLDRLTRSMKSAAESLKQKNEEQKKEQAGKQLRQGAEDLKRAGQKMKQMQNQKRVASQLQDLKDAIRRAKPQRGGSQQKMSQRERMARITEWEQRAAGRLGNPQAWRQTQGQDGQQGKGQPGQQDQTGNQGDQTGRRWGTEHDENLMDDPTKMANAKFENDQLKGAQGQGPSRRQTILTSAQKGFAQTSYRQVYTEYRKVVEEVMSQEKVPQGYKYYVKRYFQRIKPHSMD